MLRKLFLLHPLPKHPGIGIGVGFINAPCSQLIRTLHTGDLQPILYIRHRAVKVLRCIAQQHTDLLFLIRCGKHFQTVTIMVAFEYMLVKLCCQHIGIVNRFFDTV